MAAVAPAWLLGLFLLRTTAAEEAFEDNGVRCQYRQIKDKARRKEDLFRGKRERERETYTHTHIYIYIHTHTKFTLNERNMLEGQHIVERLKMLSTTSPGLLGAHCSFGSKEEIVGAVRHDICR